MTLALVLLAWMFGAQVSPWQAVIVPAGGLKTSTHAGVISIISEGDTAYHVAGNTTLLVRQGTKGAQSVSASVSFSNVQGAQGWLNTRLDRSGICNENTPPFPDAEAACLTLGTNKQSAVALCVGSAIPFKWQAPEQSGGIYNSLFLVDAQRDWRIIGTPVILPELPLDTPGTVTLSFDEFTGYASGSIQFGDIQASTAEKLSFIPEGLAGIAVVSHPNMLCLQNKGQREVKFSDFVSQ